MNQEYSQPVLGWWILSRKFLVELAQIHQRNHYLWQQSVQFSHSVMSNSLRHHEPQHAKPLCVQLPESIQTHVHWVGDAIQPSHPLSPLLLPPSIFPSISVFSNESALCIRWPKYWSFSFNISPSNKHSGVISFRMDWLDLLALQGTFKSLLQHHS